MNYLQVGEGDFCVLVAAGLPLRKMENGRIIAHPENLEAFLKQYTRTRIRDAQEITET